MIVAVDVDGVVADLHSEWIYRYNKDYNDNMTEQDITIWHMEQCVKKECGTKIYEYLRDPEIYNYVKPIKGSLGGLQTIKNALPNVKIVFASSCGENTFDQKIKWLINNKYLDYKEARKNFIGIGDKSLLNADILIDDHGDNIVNFNGIGILFDKPYNRTYSITNIFFPRFRVFNWKEISAAIMTLSSNKELNKNVARRNSVSRSMS